MWAWITNFQDMIFINFYYFTKRYSNQARRRTHCLRQLAYGFTNCNLTVSCPNKILNLSHYFNLTAHKSIHILSSHITGQERCAKSKEAASLHSEEYVTKKRIWFNLHLTRLFPRDELRFRLINRIGGAQKKLHFLDRIYN